jgi:O-antigen/teichoic acid export membrane protein
VTRRRETSATNARGVTFMATPVESGHSGERAAGRVRRYLHALTSNYVLLGVSLLTQVVTVPIFLSALGPHAFGTWLMILQATQIISFATTWIAVPVIRASAECYVTQDRNRARVLYQTAALYYAALGTLVTGSGLVLLALARGTVDDWPAVAVALLQLPVYMQFNLSFSLLAGYQRMSIANLLLATIAPLSAVLGAIGLWAGLEVVGLALGLVAATALVTAAAWVLARPCWRGGRAPLRIDRPTLRSLITGGVGHLGYSAAYFLRQSDVILVGLLLGPPAAAVYGIAFKLADVVVQLVWKIPDSLYPLLAELDAAFEHETAQQWQRLGAIVAVAVASLGGLLTAAFGRDVVTVWVGSTYAAPPAVLGWLGLLVALQVLVHASTIGVYGTTHMKAIAAAAVTEGVVKVALTWALLPRLGLVGAPLGSVLASVGLTAWYVPWQAGRRRGHSGLGHLVAVLKPVVPAAALAGLAALATRASDWPPAVMLAAGVPVVAVCYVVGLYLLGLDAAERAGLKLALRRLSGAMGSGVS